MRTVRLTLLIAIACLRPPVAAQDSLPAAQVEVQHWALEQARGLGVGARVSLDEDVDLRAYGVGARGAPEHAHASYAEVRWGDLRIGGGTLDGDGGLHVGYSPDLVLNLGDRTQLSAGADLAAGLGFLAGERQGSGPELISAGLSLYLEGSTQPWERLTIRAGGYAEILGAAARPTDDPALEDVIDLARDVDLGLAGALSRGAVGAFAGVDLELAAVRLSPGTRVRWSLGYDERWDWIHLDPTVSVLRELEPFGLEIDPVPLRTTRALHTRVAWVRGDARLALTVEGQHIQGSTTHLEFSDRNGWSLAARLEGGLGAAFAELELRTHLQEHRLDGVWGKAPRTQVKARAGGVVYDSPHVGLRVEGRFVWTPTDAYGYPRQGYAASVGLALEFGGRRSARDRLLGTLLGDLTRSRQSPLRRRRAPKADPQPETPTLSAGQVSQPVTPTTLSPGTLEATDLDLAGELTGSELSPDALAGDLSDEDLKALGDSIELPKGGGRIDVGKILASNPNLARRAGELLKASRPALAVGYGTRDVQAAVVSQRASRDAVTERIDPRASLNGITARVDPETLRVGPLEITRESLLTFSSRPGIQSFSLLEPHGDRLRLVTQARSPWSRRFEQLLSGWPRSRASLRR